MLLTASIPVAAQSPHGKPELPALRKELLERVAEDQAIRSEIIEFGLERPDSALSARMAAIDSANTTRMKSIIEQYGFPGSDLVGVDGANAAFLLIQHADSAFQKRVLPLVRDAYEKGDLTGQSYALLLDRVLVADGEDQVYGTRILPMNLWEGGPEPYPIRDRSTIDERRSEVGLPPLDAYLQVIEEMYAGGSDIDGE